MGDERDAEGLVEGREPRERGISYTVLAQASVGLLALGIGALLWQVIINTGRIGVLETRADQVDRIAVERAAALAERLRSLEQRAEKLGDKQEQTTQRLELRVDAVSSMCEALSRKLK